MDLVASSIKDLAFLEAGITAGVGIFFSGADAEGIWNLSETEWQPVQDAVWRAVGEGDGVALGKAYLLTANMFLAVLRATKQELVGQFATLSAAGETSQLSLPFEGEGVRLN